MTVNKLIDSLHNGLTLLVKSLSPSLNVATITCTRIVVAIIGTRRADR